MIRKVALAALVLVVAITLTYFAILPAFNTNQSGINANVGSRSQASSQGVSAPQPLVPADQIISGGPPPDGIPSIDNPKFISPSAATFLSDSDQVVGISYQGQAKVYPLSILVWHEIVNDVVGGTPVAITYCPLCYTTLAFLRQLNGQTVTFGTSGRLYNNNLVMYDRLTRTLWSQAWGQAIVGNLTGYKLQRIPIDVMSFGDWKKLYPNTLVLSTDTGFSRPYGSDPYGGYYTDSSLYFPLNHQDGRLPLKKIVLGLSIGGSDKAYPVDNLKPGVISDSLGGQKVVLFVEVARATRAFSPVVDGRELHFNYSNGTFLDNETHSTWNYDGVAISGSMQGKSMTRYFLEGAFWFAWAAFYPNTQIYGSS